MMKLYRASSFDEILLGGTYQGVVSSVKDFGLFVRIDNSGRDGLAHASKVENFHANKSKYVLGARVVVQVLDVNTKDKKVSLRISDADQVHVSQVPPVTLVRNECAVAPQALTEQEAELFDYWGLTDKQIIGFYHRDETKGLYVVDDIRKANFEPIPYYPGDAQEQPVKMYFKRELEGVRLNDYYVFTWKLSNKGGKNPYEIWIDHSFPIKPIDPKSFIETLFADRYNDKSKNFGSAANFIDTLSKQLTANDSTFVYELLQNANDYPQEGKTVDVAFEVTDHYLLFRHSGRVFDVRNISGICGINENEKTANKKAIGYKGIGFKTVFQIAHYVYIRTGAYSFRFEEKAKQIKRLRAPWPILPVWTTREEVADEVKQVFDAGAKDYPVQIALRPERKDLLHEGKGSYESLLGELFADSNVILFVPNIGSVRVVVGGQEVRRCIKNKDRWQVDWLPKRLPLEFQASVNKTVDTGKSRIPEKYKDFSETQVAFACRHTGAVIEPLTDAKLYCYLPTGASWGFPFLMNTDMIPKGDRNDIETEVKLVDENGTNFNEELAAVAGGLFFEWIHDLLISGKYERSSVYSLIPDFAKCVREHRNYESFISRFKTDFEEKIKSEPIVALENTSLALVQDVVLDETGLMGTGILSDAEFYAFSGYSNNECLPASCVRTDVQFNKFLRRYCDKNLIFSQDSLHALVRKEGFRGWLKIQENNDKFLRFLLDKGYLGDFFGEEIFIEDECGKLFKAADLYYDVDAELEDLRPFSRHICYLSLKTRDCFAGDEKWEEIRKDMFAAFSADAFIKKVLLSDENWDETVVLLHDKDASLHFYQFLAKQQVVPTRLKDLPFFSDEEESRVVDDFNGKIVFKASAEGRHTCAAAWLEAIPFAFVSDGYGSEVVKYLEQNAGVRSFADQIIVDEIILGDCYRESVNQAQQKDLAISRSFVDYCFAHRDCFGKGTLSQYALHAADGNGEWNWILSEDHVYFSSTAYDDCSSKSWLDRDWMYCLDDSYLQSDDDGRKDFVREAFGVSELTAEKFYRKVVKRHAEDIIKNTSGDRDSDGAKNFDFVAYLDENYDLIFSQEKDADRFEKFVVIVSDGKGGYCDFNADSDHVYLHDEALSQIVESPWFPKDLVLICSARYGGSRALAAIGVKTFEIGDFFNDVIVSEFPAVRDAVNDKDKSIAFHAFVLENKANLTDTQKQKMKEAPVYLCGQESASLTSSGHRVLSSKARELQELGLVEFSDLDIISPEYHPEDNADYWETLLENTKFTVVDFVNWANDNQEVFRAKIQDPGLNVKFWRWLKESDVSDETLKSLPQLPICLKQGTLACTDDVVYLSDEYLEGGGVEALVKNFNPKAVFVSPAYLDDGDDVAAWQRFWIRLGVRFEILGILRDAIDNRLGEIEDAKLVSTLATHRTDLEKNYGEADLLSKLAALRLRSRDGQFRSLNEIVYVDCEKSEPFPCVELPNQVSFVTADERRLMTDVLNVNGGSKIDSLQGWRRAKISRYLQIQEDASQIDLLRSIHYAFVDELAVLCAQGLEELEFEGEADREKLELVRKVLFLDRKNQFVLAERLTEGSAYEPFCDFERFGLEYDYLSDSYKTSCASDVRRLLSRVFHVHYDFREDDIPQLENRDFAVYFWKDYLPTANFKSRIQGMIEERKFDSVACIPTKDHMKRPDEVYSPDKNMALYVKAIEDFENKVPLKDIPEVEYDSGKTFFALLLNKKENLQLSFLDALYALFRVVGQGSRSQLLEWMIDSYDPKYDENIRLYRADDGAKWKNTKNDDIHIAKLYALAYGNKLLEQYFGTLPQIINSDYLPSGENFAKACEILGVKVIGVRADDVIIEPHDASRIEVNTSLKIKALVC